MAFQLVNGQVIYYEGYYGPGYDGASPDEMAICTEHGCNSAYARALVKGQEVEGGDLLILDVTWSGTDSLEIFCPDIFQEPKAELLGCQAEDPSDCDMDGSCTGTDILCFDEFDVDRDGEQTSANVVSVDTSPPTGDWIRVRLAVYCENADFDFEETTFPTSGGGKGKGGRRLTRGGA